MREEVKSNLLQLARRGGRGPPTEGVGLARRGWHGSLWTRAGAGRFGRLSLTVCCGHGNREEDALGPQGPLGREMSSRTYG